MTGLSTDRDAICWWAWELLLQFLGPGGEEVSQRWDARFGGGQVLVAESGEAAEHLRRYPLVEAGIDPGGLLQEVIFW
jgi:hypothetical protein